MRRFPFNPFPTVQSPRRLTVGEARRQREREAAEAAQSAAEMRGFTTWQTSNRIRGYTIGPTEHVDKLEADVADLLPSIAERGGITFHRPTSSYVWCDHHCAIHAATFDIYGEGDGVTSECSWANWRSVFVESTDPDEDFG
jgi:hypothetical protein